MNAWLDSLLVEAFLHLRSRCVGLAFRQHWEVAC